MNIALLAAGAGDMLCGSCLRDNAMAGALLRLGQRVTLIPLYSPLRTDADDVSRHGTFYGGINVFLQHSSPLFRHTPRLFDWMLDRGWLLRAAGNLGAQTSPDQVARLTCSILEGPDGPVHKELRRLIAFLKTDVRPNVVSLPNLMFVGIAGAIGRELRVPVVCELTGEDVFLDAMSPPHRRRVRELIRGRVGEVDRFVAASASYADTMADYLGVPRDEIAVVPTGVPAELLTPVATREPGRPPTVGYLARLCPEKGLDRLVDAMLILRRRPGFERVRLVVAGYLGRRDQAWFDALRKRVAASPLRDGFDHRGEVDQAGKIAMLDAVDVLSVPTAYAEAKGIYVLEALARGVPVVQPAHGSFPELIAQTNGGVLVPPNDAAALADALADLLGDDARRVALGRAGRAAVEANFTDERVARQMLGVYESLAAARPRHASPASPAPASETTTP